MEIAIEYEEYICDFLKNSGIQIVEHRGVILGKNGKKLLNKKDDGIDIIAKSEDTIFFIQCKYWLENYNKNLERISHYLDEKEIKAFIGSCTLFIENENNIKKYDLENNHIQRILILPNENNFKPSAKSFFKNNNNKNIKYYEIPIIKKTILGIIVKEYECWSCGRTNELICLRFYYLKQFNQYEELKKPKIYYKLKKDELPSELLGLIQKKFKYFKDIEYKKRKGSFISNVCKHCKEVQGFGHLHEKADGIFFREDELEPKHFIGLNEKTGELQYISEFYD